MKKTISLLFSITIFLLSLFAIRVNPTGGAPASAGTEYFPILFGAYPNGDLQTKVSELSAMDSWLTSQGANGVTFAADFMSITFNPGWNVEHELEAAWSNDFMPFINLMPSSSWEDSYYQEDCDTSEDIAQGKCDPYIRTWADYFKAWAGESKRAFIAPLPEANGDWAEYSTDGATFIQAYTRIQTLFQEQGVPNSAVHWVFAPNGWHNPDYSWKAFEYYYPGDDKVDIVAFSSYNYGGCPYDWASWVTFTEGFEPYLERMRTLAPSKPIFIAQTGTLDVPVDPNDPSQNKSDWVREVFDDLADYPAVRAIIYFNKIGYYDVVGSCTEPDYRIFYDPEGEPGFLEIMQDTRFDRFHVTDPRWDEINTSVLDPDTIPAMSISGNGSTIADEDNTPAIEDGTDFGDLNLLDDPLIHTFTITNQGGVSLNLTDDPPLVITGLHAGDFTVTSQPASPIPESGGTATFEISFEPTTDGLRTATVSIANDDPYRDPYTFAIQGTGTTTFGDVPAGHWAYSYIETLWAGGYTAGCSLDPRLYCPGQILNRGMSAVFILRGEYGNVEMEFPSPQEPTFADDWTGISWAEPWAELMWQDGFTAGCQVDPLKYCPWNELSRVEASVFGLHMMHGQNYQPQDDPDYDPDAVGTMFADMPDPEYWGTPWAEQAYRDGLLPACGSQDGKPLFCPDQKLDRAWAAYLVVQAKGLTPIE